MGFRLVYVEETENTFIDLLLKRRDIELIILRFSNCMSFSQEHLEVTKNIPTFIIDKKNDFVLESIRFMEFLHGVGDKVDFFYNDSEFNQEYVQKLARSAKLPGALSEEQARIVRDKVAMKDYIRKIGLNCQDYIEINSLQDIHRSIEVWGFPFIIKWRSGLSSIDVYKITTMKDLNNLDLDFESGRFIAEKYNPCKIWCIDAIVSSGQIRQNLYTWLPYTNLEFAVKKNQFVQLAVGKMPDGWQFKPKKLTQKIVSGLGLKNGYLHMEAFIDHNGFPSICEFAWRTPGEHMLSNFSRLYGINIVDVLISAFQEKTINEFEEVEKCVADVFLPMKNGRIVFISGLEDIRDKMEIEDGEIYYREGDYLMSKHNYTDSVGWIQISSVNILEMMEKVEKVYQIFKLDVVN